MRVHCSSKLMEEGNDMLDAFYAELMEKLEMIVNQCMNMNT